MKTKNWLLQALMTSKLNGFALLVILGVFVFYSSYQSNPQILQLFMKNYADFIFLTVILLAVVQKFRQADTMVDPIYWILLGAAFLSWFAVAAVRLAFDGDLSNSVQGLLSNLGYFLYYSLMIAAIELKSYRKIEDLLSFPSLLIWGSSLSFILGGFIFLVLTPTQSLDGEAPTFNYHFVFYILLDIYLASRWFYLAWVCRRYHWQGFALFGLAAITWGGADLVEGSYYYGAVDLSYGGWTDWLWYIPYFLTYWALHAKISSSSEQTDSVNFNQSHLLNSPLFFAITCFLLEKIINANSELFTPLNNTQISIFNLWFAVCLSFAVVQLLFLANQQKATLKSLRDEVSARKALQERMEQQAQSLKNQAASNQAILETTHTAIFTLNFQGTILSCNPAACELLGIAREQLLNRPFIEATEAEGELFRFFTYQSYRQRLISESKGIEIEAEIKAAKGKKIPVHATLSQDRNTSQELLVVSLINISEQKLAEQEAHNLKDQFTQNISHEFRTPLTIINGVLDNLLSHEQHQQDKAQIETAKRNVLRMIRMVEQLLELSRIANDPLPLSTVNLASILRFVCHSFEEIAKNQQLTFNYQIPQNAWVNGNAQAIEKILFNLLSNAFKYTNQGDVKVELKQLRQHFKLSVKDTGVGIAKSQLGTIFDRFHRIDNPATQGVHGVGIGLALVEQLCEAMQWDIAVTSEVKQGTQFILSIEQQNQSDNESQPVEIESLSLSQSTRQSMHSEAYDAGTKLRQKPLQKSENSVLIVEDNQDMLTHINQVLSPLHHCLLADNGEEGLRLAMDYLPDIIVSDVMMPGIDGFELLKTLKKTAMTSHIPIILLTARSDTDSKIKGLEYEADDYLSKPFDANELSLRVNNQLKSRQKLQQKLSAQWQQSEPAEPLVEDKFIVQLEQVFGQNYQQSHFTVLDLASQLAMSERQIQRKIKATLGVSPLEALKQYRLKIARQQLQSGDQIGVVAQACGFSSQSYFGRCFKESFNMTPKQFQQSVQ